MLQVLLSHKLEILASLLAISEGLASIPSIKSNSIFQLVVNLVKSLYEIVKK